MWPAAGFSSATLSWLSVLLEFDRAQITQVMCRRDLRILMRVDVTDNLARAFPDALHSQPSAWTYDEQLQPDMTATHWHLAIPVAEAVHLIKSAPIGADAVQSKYPLKPLVNIREHSCSHHTCDRTDCVPLRFYIGPQIQGYSGAKRIKAGHSFLAKRPSLSSIFSKERTE